MAFDKSTSLPGVSVVIPVRNEEKYICRCLDSVLLQTYPKTKTEVILSVGESKDRTDELIAGYTSQYSFIRAIVNKRGTIACGVNAGIRAAKYDYIVRLDAHTEFAPNYIEKCVEYLLKTGAGNVGGPTVVRGKTPVQRAVAEAYYSPFALGGGKQHIADYEGYSDTVSFGSFKKSTAEKVGLFDERLIINEDDDFNFKLAEAGEKIYITPEIKSYYYPRDSYSGLFSQYFSYGLWKVAVIKKHRRPARISHLIPALFTAFLVLGLILSIFLPYVWVGYSSILALYLLCDAFCSFTLRITDRQDGIMMRLRLMLIHFILHISYGGGFIVGLFKFMKTDFSAEVQSGDDNR